jgi:hypothetical protein
MRIIIATDPGVFPSLEFMEELSDKIDDGLFSHITEEIDDPATFNMDIQRIDAMKAIFDHYKQADGSVILDFEVDPRDDWHIGEFDALFDTAYKHGMTSISIGHLAQNMAGIHFGTVDYDIIEIVSPKMHPFQGVARSAVGERGLDDIKIIEGINDRDLETHPAPGLVASIVQRMHEEVHVRAAANQPSA